ncbi:MAG: hypothetical protein F7B78_01325 [Desulfurococcales archaeon]|nr:hypothetical protein [Desulfurococcales archaeon]
MARITLPVEATKSKSGLHAARSIVLILRGDNVSVIDKPMNPGKGTYTRGTAGTVEVEVPNDGVVVHAWLVLNPRGHVKGFFRVYNPNGDLVLEAKLTKRKVRRVSGDPDFAWAVERAVEYLKLSDHVRRYNWATGVIPRES